MVRLIGAAGTHLIAGSAPVGGSASGAATGGDMGSGQERDSGDASKAVDTGEQAASEGEASDFDAMDTASWSGAPPPVLIEDEEETIVSVPSSAGAGAGAGAATARLDEAETIIAQTAEDVKTPRSIPPSASLPPLLLERIDPSMGRGERIRLDVKHWCVRLGRAEENEVRLYTASASRVHALISGNEKGQWIMAPSEGKTVLVDGEAMSEPVELEEGMNLVLGKDHLRCVTPGQDRSEESVRTAREAFERRGSDWRAKLRAGGPMVWGAAALALLVLAFVAIWLGA